MQENQIYAQDQMQPDRSQTGYRNSQLTESEKAEFHTLAIPIMVRNCVEENSLENISQDLVQPTVPTSGTYPQASAASFDSKSEEREEITDVSHLHLHWRGPRNKVLNRKVRSCKFTQFIFNYKTEGMSRYELHSMSYYQIA